MIRRAQIEDLPRLEACAKEFYSSSAILGRLPFELDRFIQVWTGFLESRVGVIFLAEEKGEITGTIAGVLYPDAYSGTPVATEFFWIVRKEHSGPGIRLYKEFERWARHRGAQQLRMVHLWDSMPDKVARFYERLGLEPIEVHYAKEL